MYAGREVTIALSRLRERYPDLVYVMTGRGAYARELENLARAHGIQDRIRMTRFISYAELHDLYRRADIYISPSQDVDGDVEGFGIALAEAGVHGVPVIAGRSGGVDDAVVNGETGLLVNASDIDELTHALTLLLDDDERRREFGERARDRARREFAVERQGARLAAILRVGG